MGVSGSGKSTLGSLLSQSFGYPFIDGDDLHPASNVEKMSNGIPLNDADRLPWLLKIPETAIDVLCKQNARHSPGDQAGQEQLQQRNLAEVFETSAQHPNVSQQNVETEEIKQSTASEGLSSLSTGITAAAPHRPAAIFIACSALKQQYRNLLRGQNAPKSDPLRTIHLYVKIPETELKRRIHERKGHWMKEEMLNSQLATLEEPEESSGEEGIIVEPEIGNGLDELVTRCKQRLTDVLQLA
ncbi:unnamed protein product [Sympodiomycopsis kandeliae]